MASEFPSPDEIEVAEILLYLPEMILTRELNSRIVFTWGTRKRRSDPRRKNDDKKDDAAVVSQPPPPPPPKPLEVKAEATSPATPLSFSPSESDSMGNRPKRRSHHHHNKRNREEWLDHLTELTQQKAQLQIEIQKVRSYYDKLNDFNLLLRARKEELISTTTVIKKAKPDLKKGQSSSLGSKFNNQEHHHRHYHHQPSIRDRTVQIRSCDVSPLGIPDLNVPIEDSNEVNACQPLDLAISERDLSRAKASEARQRRIQINRNKNFVAANNNKLRSPYG